MAKRISNLDNYDPDLFDNVYYKMVGTKNDGTCPICEEVVLDWESGDYLYFYDCDGDYTSAEIILILDKDEVKKYLKLDRLDLD